MSTSASELLRALGGGVRPVAPDRGVSAGTGAGRAGGIEHAAFADLLAKARSGDISSGVPVSIAPGAGIELTPEQLNRVGAAADRAEAAGATRALVLIDGLSLKLDVGVRTIIGTADLTATNVLTGIDAVLHAPASVASGRGVAPQTLPARSTQNASLLRVLGETGHA